MLRVRKLWPDAPVRLAAEVGRQVHSRPLALDDIDDLTDWMRETDPASDFDLRFIDTVYEAFQFLADNPGVGHKRADLTEQPIYFGPS